MAALTDIVFCNLLINNWLFGENPATLPNLNIVVKAK